jgi:hypothetical protein
MCRLDHPRKPAPPSAKHAPSQPKTTPPAPPHVASNPQLNGIPRRPVPGAVVTPPAVAEPVKDPAHATPSTPTPPSTGKAKEKRPLLSRSSSSSGKSAGGEGGRRSSWLNNISSKFSSQSTPERPGPQPAQQPKQVATPPGNTNGATPSPLSTHPEEAEEAEPYVPSKPKEGSFFSNLTRRLSTASTSSVPKVQGTGGICQRKVLNVDPNRQRCLVPEMDVNRLRKVSFCVDVEIAGVARYRDEEESPEDDDAKQRKKKDAKIKERAEGEALKRPQAVQDEKDTQGDVKGTKAVDIPKSDFRQSDGSLEDDANGGASPPDGEVDTEPSSRKKEKKKRSEEERKVRRENRRRREVESGSRPVEMRLPDDEQDASAGSSPPAPEPQPGASLDVPPPFSRDRSPSAPTRAPPAPPGKQDRPTTDPVRIYRRCCQLRETPILKRITEQLMNPTCIVPTEPGVVNCLDLTGSRLQLADMVTLGDWLAVVPVKNLRLEDADLSDEGLRCILAGLLAAKKPEPTRRKTATPRHRERFHARHYQERSGVIEKLTLKNNPRLTRLGWKHISLFLYMCRSIKTIDLSMDRFPDTLPASAHITPVKPPQMAPLGDGHDTNAADAFYKCLAERLGGSRLEELAMSECGLSAPQIRRVVDGAIMCGISRLGLAGNDLDEVGLEHVMHYLRSGVCHGLDIGGNDLRGKCRMLAEAFTVSNDHKLPCWGLSLAGCNLVPSDLRELFPALARLPDFKFIDLSHNRDLCTGSDETISLFRRYMSKFKELKRIHLADVGMSPKQAIALADCLPDGPRLAHLNILENPQLSALAGAKDEATQEEACALYASLMAAVRVSSTLICIDIDVSRMPVSAKFTMILTFSCRSRAMTTAKL